MDILRSWSARYSVAVKFNGCSEVMVCQTASNTKVFGYVFKCKSRFRQATLSGESSISFFFFFFFFFFVVVVRVWECWCVCMSGRVEVGDGG